uniref:Uncharacterized protein n=1 Tax=Thermogladius calderae TaxID=1200300 RepID=A0A7J3XZW1_9CREN
MGGLLKYHPLYDFIILIAGVVLGIMSSYNLPATKSVATGLLLISAWLALTGFLLEREHALLVSRRSVRGALGVILLSASLSIILSLDARMTAVVVLAGLGFAGVYAYLLEKY